MTVTQEHEITNLIHMMDMLLSMIKPMKIIISMDMKQEQVLYQKSR